MSDFSLLVIPMLWQSNHHVSDGHNGLQAIWTSVGKKQGGIAGTGSSRVTVMDKTK